VSKQTKPKLKSFGTILKQSWSLYRLYFVVLVGYAAWSLLPYTVFVALNLIEPLNVSDSPINYLYFLLILAQGVIIIWAYNAIVLTVYNFITGKKVKRDEISRNAWTLIVPLLIVSLLTSLLILGGLILFIIPGIIFAIWLAFAEISVLIDGKRGFDALKHSKSLVKGRFLPIARLVISGSLFIFLVYIIITSVMFSLGMMLQGGPEVFINATETPLWADIIQNVLSVMILPLFAVYWTVLYQNVKETV